MTYFWKIDVAIFIEEILARTNYRSVIREENMNE